MPIQTTVQTDEPAADVPETGSVSAWVDAAAAATSTESGEVTVRFVGAPEMIDLNSRFRGRDVTTNVLSFEFEDPPGMDGSSDILGDIVICAEVVHAEAREFGIEVSDRFAHMIVHGFLHLVGFDHLDEADAEKMERVESQTLLGLGLSDPWGEAARVSA